MSFKQDLFLIFLIVLVLAGGYFWYTQLRPVPVFEGEEFSQESIFGRDFLSLRTRMQAIQINADFLQSESFVSLKDLTPIVELPQKTGRPNPFLPLFLSSSIPVEESS